MPEMSGNYRAMSAIGLSGNARVSGGKGRVIGAHADFRPEDFRFRRQQSRLLSEAKWESRIQPMHSWSEIALYSGAAVVLVMAIVSMIA